MLTNPQLVKSLQNNGKYESFLEKLSSYDPKKQTQLFSLINSVGEEDISDLINLIDKVEGFKDLSYPSSPIERKLYNLSKQGVGKGEIYAVFSVKGALNSPTNLYDILQGEKKIEVKQINKPTDPSDPAKKGRLSSMESFNEILPILNDLQKLSSDEDFLNFLKDKDELKQNIEQLVTPDFLSKIRSGEITQKSYGKKDSGKDKFSLIGKVIVGLHNNKNNPLAKDKDNYNLYRLFNHPYIQNPRSILRQLIKDRDSVWKYDSEGQESELYVLLYIDSEERVLFDRASVIFPGRVSNKQDKEGSRNVTNISRGGLRFYKNPNLEESIVKRLQQLAGINLDS